MALQSVPACFRVAHLVTQKRTGKWTGTIFGPGSDPLLSKTLAFKDQAVKGAAYDGVGRETEYRIEGQPGLALVVQPPDRSGTSRKTSKCYYSATVGSVRHKRKPTLGQSPATTLATARRLCADIMEQVDAGRDPVGEEKAKQFEAQRAQLTFADMLEDYVKDQSALDLVTIGEIERDLRKDALPLIDTKKPSEITPREIEEVVDEVSTAGTPRTSSICPTARLRTTPNVTSSQWR